MRNELNDESGYYSCAVISLLNAKSIHQSHEKPHYLIIYILIYNNYNFLIPIIPNVLDDDDDDGGGTSINSHSQ